jgi:hypothetical protein
MSGSPPEKTRTGFENDAALSMNRFTSSVESSSGERLLSADALQWGHPMLHARVVS